MMALLIQRVATPCFDYDFVLKNFSTILVNVPSRPTLPENSF